MTRVLLLLAACAALAGCGVDGEPEPPAPKTAMTGPVAPGPLRI